MSRVQHITNNDMKGKELLFIVISSFILTVIWIASNVYHSYVTSTIDPLLQIQIQPISPDFDSATIEKLKKRVKINPENTATANVQASPTPTLQPAPLSPTPSVGEESIEPTISPEPIEEQPTPIVVSPTP